MSQCGCGCCNGVRVETPAPTYNRPGLPALVRRVGTYGQLLATMRAQFSRADALGGLTTREPDDPAMALLDCWSVVGDVLTFYQERIANEGYLGTATRPESLRELGRLVGHTPRPALGASTYLAYTLDPGSHTTIPAGSQVRSVAGPGEQPQTFETAEDLEARDEWNTLTVRRFTPPGFDGADALTMPTVVVDGTLVSVKPGDRLLFSFVGGTEPVVRVVAATSPDFVSGTTLVTLVSPAATDVSAWAKAASVAQLRIAQALQDPPGEPATADVENVLKAFGTDASRAGAPSDEFLGAVDSIAEALPEAVALARHRVTGAAARWLVDRVEPVRLAVSALLPLAYAAAHRTPPAMTALIDQARDTLCPPDSSESPDPRAHDVECTQGAALVGLTPMLAALRKEPSHPPTSARELSPDPARLFAPGADVGAKLLAAADPRLAGVLYTAWSTARISEPPPVEGLEVMRVRARPVLGTDADYDSEDPSEVVIGGAPIGGVLALDAVYDGITVGSSVVIDYPGHAESEGIVRQVAGVAQQVVEQTIDRERDIVVKVPVTVLTIDDLPTFGDLKQVTVWAQGEPLTPLGDPETADVSGSEIRLDRLYSGIAPGRLLIISGERTDVPFASGVTGCELVMVGGVTQHVDPTVPGDSVHTTLELVTPLSYSYVRDSITLYGNVAAATQGETRTEVLGSGDASATGQTFSLRQVSADRPLTALPANTPTGEAAAVSVRVNGVRWHEVEGLVWAGPSDHAYVVDERAGTAQVAFGDGILGARPATGVENVTAVYRVGAGASGNVHARQIAQLATRPLGLNAVVNPLPASGGSAADGPVDTRAVAPLRVHALDRLVSTQDYEDFARARAGIGKASARRLFDGQRAVVHVTIAGVDDVRIDESSLLFTSLAASLASFGDPHLPVRLAVREVVTIVMAAGVRVLDDYSWADVEPVLRATVLRTLGFARQELGQPAYLSTVVGAMQAVPGVDYVDVDVFKGVASDASPLELLVVSRSLDAPDPCVPARLAAYAKRLHTVAPGDTLTSIAHTNGLTLDQLVALNPRAVRLVETGSELRLFEGIRPAQLAVLPAALPEALSLRRIR